MACLSIYESEGLTTLMVECAESIADDTGSTVGALTQVVSEMTELLTAYDSGEIPSNETRLVLVSRAMDIRSKARIRAALKELS